MTRFIKTNVKANVPPIYLREDISVIYEDVGITPIGEITFYSPEEGKVLGLSKLGHHVTIDDFLPALSAGNNGFIRMPVHWSSEKEYAAAYIRPEAVTFLAAAEPHDLAMNPGHKGVRLIIGVRGVGQITTHALPLSDFGTLINALKTSRPDLIRLSPKDAIVPGMTKSAVTLIDPARLGRLRMQHDRISLFYSGCGTIDLKKPEIDKDALFEQAIADDPTNNDLNTLAKIFNDAERIRSEDLQSLGRSLAQQSPHLTEIKEASVLYFTTTSAIARISLSQNVIPNELNITYYKSFSPAYDLMTDAVRFDTPEKMAAALEKLTTPPVTKQAVPQPPKP